MLKLFNWDGTDITINPKAWEEVKVEFGK
jgi:hypothetical protein